MRSACSLCLLLIGCDALFTSNPKNCIENPRACGSEQVCNQQTQSCEERNCRESSSQCSADQHCDPISKLCVPLNCVETPSQCDPDQRCNQTTRHCETRPFVLGQPDAQTNMNAAYGLNAPQGVLLVPDSRMPGQSKLLVADRGNRRVLIWNSVPTQNRPADSVLGMPDVHTLSPNDAYGGISEASMLAPSTLTLAGNRLAVADTQAHRILFWNQIPSVMPSKGPIPASSLWGQTNFLSTLKDSPNGLTNRLGVFGPGACFLGSSGRFFVPDQLNNRVLIFDTAPNSPSQSPSVVFGQLDFDTGVPGIGVSALNQPRQVSGAGSEIFVADSASHRVMVFDASAPASGQAATAVLGQALFTSGSLNRGAGLPAANSLSGPQALHVIDGAPRLLWVADTGNHRVLRYTVPAPTQTDVAADLVLGQLDFTSRLAGSGTVTAANSLNSPAGIHSDGTRLVVSDTGSNRVLIWNSLPSTNQQPADVVLGQASATSSGVNNPRPPQPLAFNQVSYVTTDGTRLFVVDSGNNRVLIWNQLPLQGLTPPDVVVGQPDFTTVQTGTVSNGTLDNPSTVAIDNGRMAVADRGNNRVLVWNAIPTQNGARASACLGQLSCSSRLVGESQNRMSAPSGVSMSSGRLFVADTGNSRVLWLSATAATGTPAEGLVGQPSFGLKGPNTGGQSAATLSTPRHVLATPTQLLVADSGNHRVLLWDSWPSTSGVPADRVIGQEDFASSYTRTSRSRLQNPSALLLWQGALYVASSDQNRILVWSTLPTQNGQAADVVIGQPDFVSSLPNHPEQALEDRLNAPVGLAASGHRLFVAEANNNRVSVQGLPSIP